MNRVLDYDSWEGIDEKQSSFDKVANWISKNLGGKVSKLDSLLADLKVIHSDFHDEWEDTIVDMDSLEVQMDEIKKDPAELKKLKRIYERKKDLLEAIDKKKEVDLKKINKKAEEIFSGNKRLQEYWDLEQSKLDADLAKEMYEKSKKLSDSSAEKTLYNKYEKALQKAKKKDEDFQKRYMGASNLKKSKGSSYSHEILLKQENGKFEETIKKFGKSEIVSLINYLRGERNERYAMLDSEKEVIEKQIKMAKNPKEKKELVEKIRSLSEQYMDTIRDLRTKITIAKRYA